MILLLDGDRRERAEEAVLDIAGALADAATKGLKDPSLAAGGAGLALFYRYLAAATGRAEYEEVAARFLDDAIDAVVGGPVGPSLYEGFVGIAWVTSHIDPEDDTVEEVDEFLAEHLERSPWDGSYDLISGLAGFGLYGLERLPRPAARDCVARVVDRLEENAEWSAEGVTWHTAPELLPRHQRERTPGGHYNLGVAHGLPGAVAFLAAACAAGVAEEKARPLLDGAVRWLLAQRLPEAEGARLPSWVASEEEPRPTSSAWCHGDPGAAAALLVAARCAGEPAWEHEALALARLAARRPREEAGILSAGLCHGAAGLGHIFNRLSQATGEEEFAAAARFWLERSLDMRRPGEAVAGFGEPGLLTGAAGIGLALLAATGGVEPRWDRVLLLSPPGLADPVGQLYPWHGRTKEAE